MRGSNTWSHRGFSAWVLRQGSEVSVPHWPRATTRRSVWAAAREDTMSGAAMAATAAEPVPRRKVRRAITTDIRSCLLVEFVCVAHAVSCQDTAKSARMVSQGLSLSMPDGHSAGATGARSWCARRQSELAWRAGHATSPDRTEECHD